MRKAFVYRIYPSKPQERRLEQVRETCRRFYNDLDCCVLVADHPRWSGWSQLTLFGKHVGKHRFGGLALYEAFMDVEQQLLNQRLGLLTTRFPDGFDGEAPFYR